MQDIAHILPQLTKRNTYKNRTDKKEQNASSAETENFCGLVVTCKMQKLQLWKTNKNEISHLFVMRKL